MDERRAHTHYEKATAAENATKAADKSREPRKRFVGRRTAAEKLSQITESNGTIEETGAVEGEMKDLRNLAGIWC